jgi:flagellar protein FlbD
MILLTKINNSPIALNSDLIEYIEETPDTVITLANNDRIVVQESMVQIIEKVVDFRRMISGLVDREIEKRQSGEQR